jgi:hypothetical protein
MKELYFCNACVRGYKMEGLAFILNIIHTADRNKERKTGVNDSLEKDCKRSKREIEGK